MSIEKLVSRVSRLEQGENLNAPVPILHRREGETAEECVARERVTRPAYVFPPPEPRDENGELAASWIAGCLRWTGQRIEPVGPDFDPRTCSGILFDPHPEL